MSETAFSARGRFYRHRNQCKVCVRQVTTEELKACEEGSRLWEQYLSLAKVA